MKIDFSMSIFYHVVMLNNLYDQLNYNLHSCNCTNQYICYFNTSIFEVYAGQKNKMSKIIGTDYAITDNCVVNCV